MSCDDMYVCEDGVCLPSCRIKIVMGKCDKFADEKTFCEFMRTKRSQQAFGGNKK